MSKVNMFTPSANGLSTDLMMILTQNILTFGSWKANLKKQLLAVNGRDTPHTLSGEEVYPLQHQWGGFHQAEMEEFLEFLGFTEDDIAGLWRNWGQGGVDDLYITWKTSYTYKEIDFEYLISLLKDLTVDLGIAKVGIEVPNIAYSKLNHPTEAERVSIPTEDLGIIPMSASRSFARYGDNSIGPSDMYPIPKDHLGDPIDPPPTIINLATDLWLEFADVKMYDEFDIDITDEVDDLLGPNFGSVLATLCAVSGPDADNLMPLISSVKSKELDFSETPERDTIPSLNGLIAVYSQEYYDLSIPSSLADDYDKWADKNRSMVSDQENEASSIIITGLRNVTYLPVFAATLWSFRDSYVKVSPYSFMVFDPDDPTTDTRPFIAFGHILYLREDWLNHANPDDILYVISTTIDIHMTAKSSSFLGIGGFVGKFLGGLVNYAAHVIAELWDIFFRLPLVKLQFRAYGKILANIFGGDADKWEYIAQETFKVVVYIIMAIYSAGGSTAAQGTAGAEAGAVGAETGAAAGAGETAVGVGAEVGAAITIGLNSTVRAAGLFMQIQGIESKWDMIKESESAELSRSMEAVVTANRENEAITDTETAGDASKFYSNNELMYDENMSDHNELMTLYISPYDSLYKNPYDVLYKFNV